MKRFIRISALIASIAIIAYCIWKLGFQSAISNRSSKAALSQMHSAILPGDSEDQVDEAFRRFRTKRTTLRKDSIENTWTVDMPFELGSGDWVLYVQFSHVRKVSAVAMRTSDGLHFRPEGSPEDQGALTLPNPIKVD
jgi:hypothetical protein